MIARTFVHQRVFTRMPIQPSYEPAAGLLLLQRRSDRVADRSAQRHAVVDALQGTIHLHLAAARRAQPLPEHGVKGLPPLGAAERAAQSGVKALEYRRD